MGDPWTWERVRMKLPIEEIVRRHQYRMASQPEAKKERGRTEDPKKGKEGIALQLGGEQN